MENEIQPGTPVVIAPFEGDDAAPAAPAKPEATAKPDKAAKPDDEVSRLREENVSLRRRATESEQSERFWADKAKSGGEQPKRGPQIVEPEVELGDLAGEEQADDEAAQTPEKFLDELNEKGIDAVISALRKRGLVLDKDQVLQLSAETSRRVVQHERGKMTIDAQISTDFPELKDDTSDLFQRTSKIFRQNVELDPNLRKSPAALLMAARQAKAELKFEAPPKQKRDYRQDGEEREEADARQRRINAQRGDLGRGGGGTPFEGDEDDLGPAARGVIQLFAKAGVDEKAYREERAKLRRARG
jgi:hypothetical protein